MSTLITNYLLAGAYLVTWIATLIVYQWKRNIWDGGSLVMMLYILYAIFSLLTLHDPLFSEAFLPLRFFPYLYLYTMMMIALSPVIYHHFHPITTIKNPNTRILTGISILIIVCAVLMIPDIISNFSKGLTQLFTDTEAGKDAYMEQIEDATDAGSKIRNIPAIIYNALSDISVFILFYSLTLKHKNYGLIGGLLLAITIGLLLPITKGQRGGVVSGILTLIGGFFLFKYYLSRRINKIILRTGLIGIICLSLPIAAITISRFGKETGGVAGFVNWYIGQGSLYFNNYGLDAGGTRHGDRTMNLFKRLIDPDTPKNYTERRDKYHNLKLDDNFFSTFVGDFTIDFGPVAATVLFIVFNIIAISLIRPRDGTLKLYQLLVVYFTLCVSLQGGMTLFSYSDSGNLSILVFILLYAYLRYHDCLLEKYPITPTKDQ